MFKPLASLIMETRARRALLRAIRDSKHCPKGLWLVNQDRSATLVKLQGGGGFLSIKSWARQSGFGRLRQLVWYCAISFFSFPFTWSKTGPYLRAARVFRSSTGDLIILDYDHATVTHTSKIPLSDRYKILRDQISRELPAPIYEVSERGTVLREAFVQGQPLSNASDLTQERITDGIGERLLASLPRRIGTPNDRVMSALNHFDSSTTSRSIIQTVNHFRKDLILASKMWPTAFSHGDLWGGNVITDGSVWTVIDFDDVDHLPFFYDLLKLVTRHDHLARRYLAGHYDALFVKMDEIANYTPLPNEKAIRLLATYLISNEKRGASFDIETYQRWKDFNRQERADQL